MPTQHDFNALADALELLGSELASRAGSLAGVVNPALLTGGWVGTLVTQTVDQSTRDLSASSVRVGVVVEECRRRADACKRFTDLSVGFDRAMASYRHRAANLAPGEWLGSPPWPPTSPGPWAECG